MSGFVKICFQNPQILKVHHVVNSTRLYTHRYSSVPIQVHSSQQSSINRHPGNDYHRYSSSFKKFKSSSRSYRFLAISGAILAVSGLSIWHLRDYIFEYFPNVESKSSKSDVENDFQTANVSHGTKAYGEVIDGLPVYTSDVVAKHDSIENRIWVSYKQGVYDITDFVPKHPGGDKILMGSGGRIDVFWDLFPIHKTPQVLEMLEQYRIGNLSLDEDIPIAESTHDPFSSDPRRSPLLTPASSKPFNAEPPNELLVANFITPNELFFVRNHLPVPVVDEESYMLEVEGIGIHPLTLTLNELKTKFPKYTITSTIQCAGNRRSELNKVKEVKGLNWGTAAISTATWSGVRLVDVLLHAGVKLDDVRIQHIQFEGLDTDPANFPYGASIPAYKGLDPNSDVLLAYEMNGETLPRDHGYPVRVIVPGVVGARNVKWLKKIEVSSEESKSHWQQNDYKGFSPNITWDNVDFKTSPAIQELPVTSVICEPSNGSSIALEEGMATAKGYAWSGGGRKIVRVDVSADGGETWYTATLEQNTSPLHKAWAWTLWHVQIPVATEKRKPGSKLQFICKAVDASYNVQPDTVAPIWNLRGVLSNAWHRINVTVK